MSDSEKWAKEKQALKKVQWFFSFDDQKQQSIRRDALEQNIRPTDVIRKLVGLSYRKIQRPRVTITLSEEEIEILAQRYDVEVSNRVEIQHCLQAEVDRHYYIREHNEDDD